MRETTEIVVISESLGRAWSVWETYQGLPIRRLEVFLTKGAAEAMARWIRAERVAENA